MKTLTKHELKNWKKNSYTLIHVLPSEHYQHIHIKDAINICVFEASFAEKIKNLKLNAKEKIVLYGESDEELDAKSAAAKLQKLGFEDLYILQGGLSASMDTLEIEGNTKDQLDTNQLVSLNDGTYSLRENSVLEWSGANANGKHSGVISLKSGNIEVKNALISGEFIIDMNSIKNTDLSAEEGSEHLEAHLRSEDFFLTKLFPEARYKFKDISPVKTPYQTDVNYILEGELSIKGVPKEQSIKSVISSIDGTLVLTARAELDRTRWGIVYGSSKFFKYLGMHKLFDNIQIEMRLELV